MTARGLALFAAIAVVIDTLIALLGGLFGAGMIAIWRDVTAGDKPIRDRGFAVP